MRNLTAPSGIRARVALCVGALLLPAQCCLAVSLVPDPEIFYDGPFPDNTPYGLSSRLAVEGNRIILKTAYRLTDEYGNHPDKTKVEVEMASGTASLNYMNAFSHDLGSESVLRRTITSGSTHSSSRLFNYSPSTNDLADSTLNGLTVSGGPTSNLSISAASTAGSILSPPGDSQVNRSNILERINSRNTPDASSKRPQGPLTDPVPTPEPSTLVTLIAMAIMAGSAKLIGVRKR